MRVSEHKGPSSIFIMGPLLVLVLCAASSVAFGNSNLPKLEKQTSTRGYEETPFIVGGDPIPAYSRPYLVLVSRGGNAEFQEISCGGAILADQWVVTAAHCVKNVVKRVLRVTAGEHHVRVTEGKEQRVKVDKIFIHKKYNANELANDIALLKLKTPLDLSQPEVGVIAMNTDNDCPSHGETCTVMGWGSLWQGGNVASVPNAVDVPAMRNQKCKRLYRGLTIFGHNICAGETGKDSCQGDSGGPMVCTCGGEEKHVGIVSWGYGCALEGYPGVYTRISKRSTWAEKCMQREGGCNADDEFGNHISRPRRDQD